MIAWAITGGEYLLRDCVQIIKDLGPGRVEIFLSRAGEEVLGMLRLADSIKGFRVYHDETASSPEVKLLYKGRFKLLVVAPATSNTVAKFVCGISDTLVTNMFSQAGKLRIPIYVLPTDAKEVVEYTTPSGKKLTFLPRKVDLENVHKLQQFEGVTVFGDCSSLRERVFEILND